MDVIMKKTLLGLVLLSSAGAVHAENGPNWNFIDVSYLSADVDGEEFSGLGIAGSKLVGEDFFVTGSYSSIGAEIEGIDFDVNSTSFGLGYRYGASATTDIFGAVSYQRAELDASYQGRSFNVDDNGYGLELGLRSLLTSQLEVTASMAKVTIDDESETVLSISSLFHINEQFGIGAGYAQGDDVDTLSFSALLFF